MYIIYVHIYVVDMYIYVYVHLYTYRLPHVYFLLNAYNLLYTNTPFAFLFSSMRVKCLAILILFLVVPLIFKEWCNYSISQFDINITNKRVLTSYLLNLCFRTQGDTGMVNKTAIWYIRGTWKWSLGSYSKRRKQNAVSRDEVLIYIWAEGCNTSVTLREEVIMKELAI